MHKNYLPKNLLRLRCRQNNVQIVPIGRDFKTALPSEAEMQEGTSVQRQNFYGSLYVVPFQAAEIIDVDCKYDLTGKLFEDF